MASEGKLKGKVALVTGGSRGIGREVSAALGAEGASVVVVYQGSEKSANETVALVEKTGSKAITAKANVSSGADVAALFDKATEAFGKIDIVVHLAGILFDTYPKIVDTTEEQWDEIFTINAKGSFLVSKEAAKRLGPGGRIILTSSSLVGSLLPGYGSYAATKSAVETLAKILAKELKGKQVTVNVIAPGPIATELFFAGKTQETIDNMVKTVPLGRLGEPKDIASVTVFLASPAAEWVNGQVIRINGGTV